MGGVYKAPSMTEMAINVKGLSQRFGQTWVLAGSGLGAGAELRKGVDLRLSAGHSVAVLGPNGCGKTTLLKILATRLAPTRGEGTVLGFDLRGEAEAIRRQTEWLGHELGLYKTLSGRENLEFYFRMKGEKPNFEKIAEVLVTSGLVKMGARPVAVYSQGQKKRLALARILLGEPKLILLDEPHANLDAEGKALMNVCIAAWKKSGTTILMASHDHSEVLPLCDSILNL